MSDIISPSRVPAWFNGQALPWCIKFDSSLGEFVVYPRGKSTAHPEAYHTDCAGDAVATAMDLCERGAK